MHKNIFLMVSEGDWIDCVPPRFFSACAKWRKKNFLLLFFMVVFLVKKSRRSGILSYLQYVHVPNFSLYVGQSSSNGGRVVVLVPVAVWDSVLL